MIQILILKENMSKIFANTKVFVCIPGYMNRIKNLSHNEKMSIKLIISR